MEKGIKLFIAEDEIITAANIQQILEEVGYEVSGIADNAEDALKEMMASPPDFALLDIQLLGKKDGIWLAEELNKSLQIPFAFITAQGDKESVNRAVKTRPYGYLIKPFMANDIYSCIENALSNFSDQRTEDLPAPTKKENPETLIIKDALFVKTGNLFVKIIFDEVLYFESDKNYVDIYTAEKKFTCRTALKEIAKNVSGEQFIQISRSVIVNIKKIDALSTTYIHVKQHKLTLSENYKPELMKRLKFITG